MEITNEIKTKVFAQYIGNKIMLDQTRFSEQQKDTIFTLSGVGTNCFQVKETKLWYDFEARFDGTLIDKIILKSLSEITDEDALGLAFDELGDNKDSKELIRHAKGKIEYMDILGMDWKSYQYLQNAGYDLPHYLLGGKTLKEAGLATYE